MSELEEENREINTRPTPKNSVEYFIRELAKLLLTRLENGSVISLSETYLRALNTSGAVRPVSSKLYGLFLLTQLRKLRDMVLDKAAEAISTHVDHIDNDVVYAELSAAIMRYAIHELNLVQTLITILEKALNGQEDIDTEFLEEFAFAALARFMAVMTAVSSLDTSRLGSMLKSIIKMLDLYISEELAVLSEKLINNA